MDQNDFVNIYINECIEEIQRLTKVGLLNSANIKMATKTIEELQATLHTKEESVTKAEESYSSLTQANSAAAFEREEAMKAQIDRANQERIETRNEMIVLGNQHAEQITSLRQEITSLQTQLANAISLAEREKEKALMAEKTPAENLEQKKLLSSKDDQISSLMKEIERKNSEITSLKSQPQEVFAKPKGKKAA